MTTDLDVVFTIDKKYVQHFSVTLFSLFENNKDVNLHVYIIHDITDTTELQNVVHVALVSYPNNLITVQRLDSSLFDKFRFNLHYSKAVYFRLLFTEILPKSINRILFMDADIVVNGSIRELINYQFGNETLLAVDDHEKEGHVRRLADLGFLIKNYFNAGVLLINLERWRELNAAKGLMELADKYMDKLLWWDQDILNMYFGNSWAYMNQRYNTIGVKQPKSNPPVFIHYSGPWKPWSYVSNQPYKKLYWHYIKITPYKNETYHDFNLKTVILKPYYRVRDLLLPDLRMPVAFKKALNMGNTKGDI